MEAINIEFAPATGSEEEWNEAYARTAFAQDTGWPGTWQKFTT